MFSSGLWRNPGCFDERLGSVQSFLTEECHGKSVDLARSQQATRAGEAEKKGSMPDLGSSEGGSLGVRHRHVREALLQLSPPERETIAMAWFGALTYKQVATKLGLSEGAVKARIRSGLSGLHDLSG